VDPVCGIQELVEFFVAPTVLTQIGVAPRYIVACKEFVVDPCRLYITSILLVALVGVIVAIRPTVISVVLDELVAVVRVLDTTCNTPVLIPIMPVVFAGKVNTPVPATAGA
jgi:hypothetical protein